MLAVWPAMRTVIGNQLDEQTREDRPSEFAKVFVVINLNTIQGIPSNWHVQNSCANKIKLSGLRKIIQF